MRADILNDGKGTLRLTPHSATEETMLNIWFADESKNSMQVKDIVMIDSYEGITSCLSATEVTQEKVESMTAEMKKDLRKKLKEELNELKVEYNGRASTSVLQAILEKVKLQRASSETEKKPTRTEPPTLTSGASVGPPSKLPKEENKVTGPAPTIDTVREALKAFAAVKGRTAAMKLLTDHEATKISELKVEAYPAFLIAASVDNG